ncbi:ATP-binding protein [Alkalibacillus salilacus]|uniref:DNA replication protein DnaC n=1 Tax=Alkalibacillus salilacus TaxID=284582 RepID=A0ABT9VD29_9BACI|nr:ATP-binding protein [Alkalibacillus salilacus]MDQ0158837.1 DNA replication protein DnaC [Alkalibacillus salilacus]
MKSAEKILNVDTQPEILNDYVCDGCGEQVEEKSVVIPVGPKKGERTTVHDGCRCEDRELAKKAIQNREQAIERKNKTMFRQQSLLNQSLWDAAFENYEATNDDLAKAKERLQDFAETFSRDNPQSFIINGNYGTGKSHLSVAVTKRLMERGYSCLFLSVPKLLSKIKETHNRNSDFSEYEVMEFVQSVDLLVLDDLGAEYTNLRKENDNWTQTKLFEVIDSRAGKSTIYTTNLDSEELVKKINERNLSRVMENVEVVKMFGQDYRRKEF